MATEQPTTPGAEEPEELSLRDQIDAAFEQHSTDEPPEGEEAPAQTGERTRDAFGRFSRSQQEGEPGQVKPEGPDAGGMAPAPQPPELKAPASWTPTAREKWATVDPEVRSEIHRREVEAQRVLQETAGVRDFARQFEQLVRPYEMFIRAENATPMQAIQSLLNSAAEMRVGTAQQKVNIVAAIVQQHGVDLSMLDDALASIYNPGAQGGAPRQQASPAEFRDPRLDYFFAQQEQARQQQTQFEEQQLRAGLAQFAQTHEFYADVADTMADLVDAATRRGQPVDLEKIYLRACQLDESVSTILSQRQAGSRNAPANAQAVLRAKRAAVSVKGDPNPEGSTVPKNDSVRAAIEAAFDAHS